MMLRTFVRNACRWNYSMRRLESTNQNSGKAFTLRADGRIALVGAGLLAMGLGGAYQAHLKNEAAKRKEETREKRRDERKETFERVSKVLRPSNTASHEQSASTTSTLETPSTVVSENVSEHKESMLGKIRTTERRVKEKLKE
eukprot:TRINITY_DN16040_c0_g1_i1.p1 TRINITY_DN16040_c0_g1~~TRINITY_DN16040_c0_g1_i1.p1  ORF type:complete len:143 (+),score=3.77 TRINITY_DN16040_c0_g1_i1:40-468(+)